MAESKEDVAKKYFNCTASERAAFEAGIKMGTIYHQFVGTPLSLENVEYLERAIEESVKVQPFVKRVKVHIDRTRIKKKQGFYKYLTLRGEMLNIELEVQYEDKVAVCRLEYVEDMNYPLMYVKEIRSE
ncbi:MAG: dihydroneopterin aldolase [Euryarchaeota archaeon]|nr:dihydroneopterin aldolase [Euryarchaeota archaeon]